MDLMKTATDLAQVSVFREPQWVQSRNILNPYLWKQHQLHASGLGFLNIFNPFIEYTERFTHIDPLTEADILTFNPVSKVFLSRKTTPYAEVELLKKHKFRFVGYWGTYVIDLSKPLNLRRDIRRNVKIGEDSCCLCEINKLKGYWDIDADKHNQNHYKLSIRNYYHLLKLSRGKEGIHTLSYSAFHRIHKYVPFYSSYLVYEGADANTVACQGLVSNSNYAYEFQLARDSECKYGADYLKYRVLNKLQKEGVRWYDLAGVSPYPEMDSKEQNIRDYKSKWGGGYYRVFEFLRR
jgi:hypothetical protein